jgi:LmbE family N-acetylglucosaminyl deacetylase
MTQRRRWSKPAAIPKPDIFQAKKVLAIQPHYDDNDIACGGTLAALVEAGAEVVYLTVTDDLVGVIDVTLPKEQAAAQLKREQAQAGEVIGVSAHYWLGYPDAGKYDYFDVRRDIIRHIRMLRPDFIFTVDPNLVYEAHTDHILTGRAASEATILYDLLRLETEPAVDAAYTSYDILGIAYYGTCYPNTWVDISKTKDKKHRAVSSYRAQFSPEDMHRLLAYLELKEQDIAEGHGCTYAEPLKVLHTRHLHGSIDALGF